MLTISLNLSLLWLHPYLDAAQPESYVPELDVVLMAAMGAMQVLILLGFVLAVFSSLRDAIVKFVRSRVHQREKKRQLQAKQEAVIKMWRTKMRATPFLAAFAGPGKDEEDEEPVFCFEVTDADLDARAPGPLLGTWGSAAHMNLDSQRTAPYEPSATGSDPGSTASADVSMSIPPAPRLSVQEPDEGDRARASGGREALGASLASLRTGTAPDAAARPSLEERLGGLPPLLHPPKPGPRHVTRDTDGPVPVSEEIEAPALPPPLSVMLDELPGRDFLGMPAGEDDDMPLPPPTARLDVNWGIEVSPSPARSY